jgi:dipeptidase E
MNNIIAIGGGYWDPPFNLKIERYVLAQSGKPHPSVCYLPNASADPANSTLRAYVAFAQLDCRMSHVNLFAPPTADLESYLLEKDVIFVGGGNTKSMLALWREWGLDVTLRKAWQKGIVLAGISAGQICWFDQGLTDSIPGPVTALNCLGFLPGSCTPHYDSEVGRRPRFLELIGSGEMMAGFATDDGAALHYVDRSVLRIVTSTPTARAFAVEKSNGTVIERPLKVTYLDN